jgi:hypothetical protein
MTRASLAETPPSCHAPPAFANAKIAAYLVVKPS